MKIVSVIAKVLTALAAIAGAVYVCATYGDQIVAWAKKVLSSMPKCKCAEEACVCAECTCEAAEEAPAEEAAPEEAAEESAAEEAAAEEEASAEEEAAADETAVVAEDTDFVG